MLTASALNGRQTGIRLYRLCDNREIKYVYMFKDDGIRGNKCMYYVQYIRNGEAEQAKLKI